MRVGQHYLCFGKVSVSSLGAVASAGSGRYSRQRDATSRLSLRIVGMWHSGVLHPIAVARAYSGNHHAQWADVPTRWSLRRSAKRNIRLMREGQHLHGARLSCSEPYGTGAMVASRRRRGFLSKSGRRKSSSTVEGAACGCMGIRGAVSGTSPTRCGRGSAQPHVHKTSHGVSSGISRPNLVCAVSRHRHTGASRTHPNAW
jgi:hypothetical protein